MELLRDSCARADSYPHNLIETKNLIDSLNDYATRLSKQRGRIFVKDGRAALDLLDLHSDRQEYSLSLAKDVFELKQNMKYGLQLDQKEPQCRFIFLHAQSTRDRLRISPEMLTFLLSYYQIQPIFLDFVFPTVFMDRMFPLKEREHLHDLYFSGLNDEHSLDPMHRNLQISSLGRSGIALRLCYNLRSANQDPHEEELQWTIGQTAVYYSFDVENGQMLWIICEGDTSMKDRMTAWLKTTRDLHSDSKREKFAAGLTMHALVCEWSASNWRWFINDLEREVQKISDIALNTPIDKFPGPVRTLTSTQTPLAPKSLGRIRSGMAPPPPPIPPQNAAQTHSKTPPEIPPEYQQDDDSILPQPFKFTLLQRTEFLEEKAQETLLVLTFNLDILKELREYYQTMFKAELFPADLKEDCKGCLADFDKSISRLENDLSKQIKRAETVLDLLKNRKHLLFVIMQYRSMQASSFFAKEAQNSTRNMEKMTQNMQKVANRTQQEAISMRVITLVTLFFLPATSIATFFGTDIVKLNEDDTRTVHGGNLGIYLGISGALTIVTYVSWWGMLRAGRRHYNGSDMDGETSKS